MTTGITGLPSIPWGQTRIDGREAAPLSALRPGAVWEWFGPVDRLDPAASLGIASWPVSEEAELRGRVARRARRIVGPVGGARPDPSAETVPRPVRFVVADGDRRHTIALLPGDDPARPRLVFPGGLPAAGRPLIVADLVGRSLPMALSAPRFLPGGLAAGTGIATGRGLIPAEDLRPGDRVLVRDGGMGRVACAMRWQPGAGSVPMAPGLRPVTIRAGAFGTGHPFRDLRLAPGQPVAVTGPEVAALFGLRRVLVPAARLAGLPGVVPGAGAAGTVFVRLVLDTPDLLLAEGLACASADAPEPGGATPEAFAAAPVAPRDERLLTPPEAARLVHALGLRAAQGH